MTTATKSPEKFAKRFKNGNVATRLKFTDDNSVIAYIYCRSLKGQLAVLTVTDKNGSPMPKSFEFTLFESDAKLDEHHTENWSRSEPTTLGSDKPFLFEHVSEAKHNGLVYPLQPTARKLVWQGFLLGLVNAKIDQTTGETADILVQISSALESTAMGSAWQKEKYGYD